MEAPSVDIETKHKTPEQILSQEQLQEVRKATEIGRLNIGRNNEDSSFSNALNRTNGVGKGDYQLDVRLLETKQLESDIVIESELYVKDLLRSGIPRVNIVDFGAGAGKTVSQVAERLQSLIEAGKVHIIATNLHGAPTKEELEDPDFEKKVRFDMERRSEDEGNIALFKRVATSNLVDFRKADILELYEAMKGEPIHLMFIMSTFSQTPGFNDAILTMAAEMLDPKKGTLVINAEEHSDWAMLNMMHGRKKPANELLKDGLDYVKAKGFQERTAGRRSRYRFGMVRIFHGPEAPDFDYEISSQQRARQIENAKKPPSFLQKFRDRWVRRAS